jgi:hypothetical protein
VKEAMMSAHLDSLRVVIQNPNAEMCMIGVLVLVGDAMPNSIPTQLHLHDRLIETQPGVKRWYSLPLTNEEVLLSDKELVLTTLGSHTAGNPPAIDQIEVFAMRKDKFGWAEKQRRLAAAKERRMKSGQAKRPTVRGLEATEKAAISIMNALAMHWSVGGLQSLESECRTCRDKFMTELPKHLVLQRQVSTRPMLKRLLKVLFPSRDVYCEAKDDAQLCAIAEILHKPWTEEHPVLLQLLSPSMLTTMLCLIARVAARRPAHLRDQLKQWPLLLERLTKCLWMVNECCRFHCSAQLERAAECVVNILHSYGMHLAQVSENAPGAAAPSAGNASARDAVMDHVLKDCLDLLIQCVQHDEPRIRTVFGQRITALVVGADEAPVTEVHFDDGSQAHDHMDPTRLGPLFWQECVMPEQGLEKDGQASVVYCCDRCGQQPVVGVRWHCRVCKDFDLCDACYHSIQESTPHRAGLGDARALSLEARRDDWLYPPNVDPSDEETLVKLAVALSLEPEQPPSPAVSLASSLLRRLCESLPSLMNKPSGAMCIPTMHLLLRLITGSSLRDDGRSMALVASSVSSALLQGGPLQSSWGARRLQAPCLAILLLSQLISGPEKSWPGGAGGRHTVPAGAERTSLRWAEQASHVLNPDALKVLAGGEVMKFLRLSLEGAMDALQAPADPASVRGSGVSLLGRSSSWLTHSIDDLYGEDQELGMSMGPDDESQAQTPDAIALAIIDVVLRLTGSLHASQAFIALAGRAAAPGSTPAVAAKETQPPRAPAGIDGGDAGSSRDKDSSKTNVAGSEWEALPALLCKCLSIPRAAPARKSVRRLLRRLFDTRQQYDAVRDRAAIAAAFASLQAFVSEGVKRHSEASETVEQKRPRIKRDSQVEVSHKDTVQAALTIGNLVKLACARVANWQAFCRENTKLLALLLDCTQGMPAETTEALLKLLSAAFPFSLPSAKGGGGAGKNEWTLMQGPHPAGKGKPASAYKKARNARSAESDSDSSEESGSEGAGGRAGAGAKPSSRPAGPGSASVAPPPAQEVAMGDAAVDEILQYPSLDVVLRQMLLQSRAPKVRAEASRLLIGLWSHVSVSRRRVLLEKLLAMLPLLAESGLNCRELIETITTLASMPAHRVASVEAGEAGVGDNDDMFDKIAVEMTRLIRREAALVAQHPNASLYQSLHRLVEMEGYYLESQPCLICTPWAEVPLATHKLDQLRAEAKFTDRTQLVKLISSHTIQSFTVTMTDVRRLKLVKTINLFYNNKPVQEITQLKGKWSLWKKFASLELAADEMEATVDLAIPIVATNIMIEFAAFHELAAGNLAQRMLCPRCNRPVTDRHGICRHCRENAFQCRLCRNINYENLDAFLCNECGYCKHARFDYTLVCKPSFIAEPILTQEDKAKAMDTMQRESENAHQAFEDILSCKKTLEKLLGYTATGSQAIEGMDVAARGLLPGAAPGAASAAASGGALASMANLVSAGQAISMVHAAPHGLSGLGALSAHLSGLAGLGVGGAGIGLAPGHSAPSSMMVNRDIQSAALVYCRDAKHAFHRMSNSVELLAAVRQQLTIFLTASASLQGSGGSGEPAAGAAAQACEDPNCSKGQDLAKPDLSCGTRNCFGCSSRLVMHALGLVQVVAQRASCRRLIMEEGLLQELIGGIMHTGCEASRRQARAVTCLLVRDNAELTSMMLQQGVVAKIDLCLEHSRALDLDKAVRDEMLLLMEACRQRDLCWELKYKIVMQLLFKAVKAAADQTAVASGLILPLLGILAQLCCRPPEAGARAAAFSHDTPPVTYTQWQAGTASFEDWNRSVEDKTKRADTDPIKARTLRAAARARQLERKYGQRWLRRWRANSPVRQQRAAALAQGDLLSEAWIRKLLLNPCSQAVRAVTKAVLAAVSSASAHRALVLLDVLAGMLALAAAQHANSQEIFSLVTHLSKDETHRRFLAARGFLPDLCRLISEEVARIRSREASSSADIAQGEVLKNLLLLLASLLEVPDIRRRFKTTPGLLAGMLDNLLHVQSLIVQKTKLMDDCAQLLMATFTSLSSESEDDKRRFCMACVEALDSHRQGRTPVFLVQQLTDLMCPAKALPNYLLILTKSPSQEEYIRGSMTKNPYSSSEIGLVMRDVKRKICQHLDMPALMDDENGMELLVRGQIVNLSLPIHLVYEQLWRPALFDYSPASAANVPMEIVFRLQGLDGEATEALIDSLPDTTAAEGDPEVEAAMTALMSETKGLAVLLMRLGELDELEARAELEPLLLNLLSSCCRLRVNRRAALSMGAVDMLLSRISDALQLDPLPASAQPMLRMVELLLQEANREDTELHVLDAADAVGARTVARTASVDSAEHLSSLLHRVGSPAVRAQPKVQRSLAILLPFLTYGEERLMEMLYQHFRPHLEALLDQASATPPAPAPAHVAEQGGSGEEISEDASQEGEAYVTCFVAVVQHMGPCKLHHALRALFTKSGLVRALSKVLAGTLPAADKDKDSEEWSTALACPCLPRVLQLLAGITRGYEAAQREVAEAGMLASVHVLEEKASEQQMGSLAEDLLMALAEGNEALKEAIAALRDATLEKKRSMAQAQRERLLQEMGLSPGQDAFKAFAEQAKAMGLEEGDLEEEEGLQCVICHEGFKYKPDEVLGVYVFHRRCSITQTTAAAAGTASAPASVHSSPAAQVVAQMAALQGLFVGSPSTPPRGTPSSSSSNRADRCYASVTNMSVVHMTCHAQATRAERQLKVPRLEWDGASLRNQNTRCNNLLPIRGPKTPAHMYSEYAERYWGTLGQLGRHEGSRFRIVVHDVRLLLLKLATGASFSTDSGGGSAHSNVKMLPFMVQLGYHSLGDAPSAPWRQASTALGKYVARSSASARGTDAPAAASPASSSGGASATSCVDGADYHAVATLWFPDKWRSNKGVLLVAMMAQALRAARVAVDVERWWEADVASQALALEVCRVPITIMAFLSRMHAMLHAPHAPVAAGESATASQESASSALSDAQKNSSQDMRVWDTMVWTLEASAAQDKLRHAHADLMGLCDDLVDFYKDELAVSESMIELLDVGELLHEISPPGDVEVLIAAASSAASALGAGTHLLDASLSSPVSSPAAPHRGSA